MVLYRVTHSPRSVGGVVFGFWKKVQNVVVRWFVVAKNVSWLTYGKNGKNPTVRSVCQKVKRPPIGNMAEVGLWSPAGRATSRSNPSLAAHKKSVPFSLKNKTKDKDRRYHIM